VHAINIGRRTHEVAQGVSAVDSGSQLTEERIGPIPRATKNVAAAVSLTSPVTDVLVFGIGPALPGLVAPWSKKIQRTGKGHPIRKLENENNSVRR
jgi:hypothetical protein